MTDFLSRAQRGVQRRWRHARHNLHLQQLNRQVAVTSAGLPDGEAGQPVVFFNASTRLTGLSLNAAYSLISSWSLRLAGIPVVHFVCQSGMTRCVLGTDRDDPDALPPCASCITQSRILYAGSDTRWFTYHPDSALEQSLAGLSLADLHGFGWQGAPLGALVLPGLRWILRRHSLPDDHVTRALYRHYLLSARSVQLKFERLLDAVQPRAVVAFNGMSYPEATARWVAWQHGLRVITHEVGLRPYTAYFTTGDATAYPIDIPESFELSPEQNAQLDAYLGQRMQGNFSMAGVRFWPEIRGLGEDFLQRAAKYEQIVPVFTNVIFDTSQPHSNVVFPHMFAWLESVLETARRHPRTLFVIRAHPDEARPGKESRESVSEWVERRQVLDLPNMMFVKPQEYFSSYELIQRAKFVMVYNSTIGLEAAIMGAAVLCAGKARYTQLPTVFFPPSQEEYAQAAERFLRVEPGAPIEIPAEFQRNARRFLYYQLYKTSLPFGDLIEEDGVWKGYVRIKDLPVSAFHPHSSATLRTIVDGILEDRPFLI
jgi:hypothetical protein